MKPNFVFIRVKQDLHGFSQGSLAKCLLIEGSLVLPVDAEHKNPRIFPFDKVDFVR